MLHLNREAYAQKHPIRERAMQGLYEMMMDYIEEPFFQNILMYGNPRLILEHMGNMIFAHMKDARKLVQIKVFF